MTIDDNIMALRATCLLLVFLMMINVTRGVRWKKHEDKKNDIYNDKTKKLRQT